MESILFAKLKHDNEELLKLITAIMPTHLKINKSHNSVTVKFADKKSVSATNSDYKFAIGYAVLKRLLTRKQIDLLIDRADVEYDS